MDIPHFYFLGWIGPLSKSPESKSAGTIFWLWGQFFWNAGKQNVQKVNNENISKHTDKSIEKALKKPWAVQEIAAR